MKEANAEEKQQDGSSFFLGSVCTIPSCGGSLQQAYVNDTWSQKF